MVYCRIQQPLENTTKAFGLKNINDGTKYKNFDKVSDKGFNEQLEEARHKEQINALAFNILGRLYYSREDYDNAKEWYEKALESEIEVFGPGHINTATTLYNLGLSYQYMKEYDKAKSLYKQALEIERKVLDPDHADIALTYNNLGIVYSNLKEYNKAKDSYERGLEIQTKVFGAAHIKIATTS